MCPGHRQWKVLIADDALEVARRVGDVLQELEQVEVIGPAANGDEARRLFQESAPDAAVLDFSMPGAGCLSLLREFRGMGQPCLLIVLTNHAEVSIRDQCLKAGADYFVSKASDIWELAELLRDYFAQRSVSTHTSDCR